MLNRERYKKKGIKRLISACHNSWKGFIAAWSHESAFRQELFIFITLGIVALFLPVDLTDKFILIMCMLPVLLVELINSAIEAIIDRISMEEHELSARAKDLGSAAVFISLLIVILVWIFILWKNFYHIFFVI